MADQAAVTVTTTATEIVAADDPRQSGPNGIIIVENRGSEEVFIGDNAVTTSTGIAIASGAKEPFRAANGKPLFGIVAAGSEEVRFFIR